MRYVLLLAPVVLLAGPARYARVGELAGAVEAQVGAADPWIAAERNTPLPESARVRTGAASRLEIELDEGSALRLGPNTQVELSDYTRLSTGQRVTLLSVDRGVVYVTAAPEGRDTLSIAVPGAQATFTRAARVRVEVTEQSSQIAILKGAARFASAAAELELRQGQTTRVEPANAARFFFYKEVLPGDLDAWSAERDEALVSPSAAHVVERHGLADLDAAGEWILSADLGAFWRPKVDEAWRPYREGKWRWYERLGYTWIAAERWGWLPYHYGRWARLDNLGWVWVPSKNGVFKPAEVYWLRGAKFTGWGPLAHGELWDPADEVNRVPQLFLHESTTYAAFAPSAAAIDPAGFRGLPKDPLKEAEFLTALPSPPFAAARLDAVRPLVNAASLRVRAEVQFPHVESRPAAPPPAPPRPIAPAPVVVITQAQPSAPPEREIVEVPVAVPAGVVFVATPPRESRHTPKPSAPAESRRRRYRSADEERLVQEIVRKLERRAYDRAMLDLERWTASFADTDFAADRAYYYMLAYNGLDRPAKVVDTSVPLVARPIRESFAEPMQALSVVYLTTSNFLRIPRPSRAHSVAARNAANEMTNLLPLCFSAGGRPREIDAGEWAKSRTVLETMARETLARAAR